MVDQQSEIPDDWNPMKEDYTNPVKNAYPNMNLAQQPGYRAAMKMSDGGGDYMKNLLTESTAPSFQLHVLAIPFDLTNDGVRHIFSKFGTVLDVFMPSMQVTKIELF
jgi:RNA recognition motif-containing protein